MRRFITLDGQTFLADVRAGSTPGRFEVEIEGHTYVVEGEGDLLRIGDQIVELASADRRSGTAHLGRDAVPFEVSVDDPRTTGAGQAARSSGEVRSPMPGKVVEIRVGPGDDVTGGECVLVVEAMKMQNELAAPREGRVAVLHVESGAVVEAGTLLLELEPLTDADSAP